MLSPRQKQTTMITKNQQETDIQVQGVAHGEIPGVYAD